MALFSRAVFVKSVAALEELPDSRAEIAFSGRSNAGKSSALNTLAGRNRLAFVSKTPGRTQLINFFALGEDRFLVDLPGYGYARVPAAIRAPWEQLLTGYLQSRKPLRGIALVMDARHPLMPLDTRMLEWFRLTGKPAHVLLTKSDKLSRTAAAETLRHVRDELAGHAPNYTAQLFSSLKKTGIEEAERIFFQWLAPGEAQDPGSGKNILAG